MTDKMRSIHPGEILLEEFFLPMGCSIQEFSDRLKIDIELVRGIMLERYRVTPEIALKLSKSLGNSYQFWFNLQHAYDGESKYFELKDSMHYFLLKVVVKENGAYELLRRAAIAAIGSKEKEKFRVAIVKASSAAEARLVISENCGGEGKKIWLSRETSHCQKIASSPTGGEACVVVKSPYEESNVRDQF